MDDSGRSRRRFLGAVAGAAVVAAAGGTGVELIHRGTLPGKSVLDAIDGACEVPAADLAATAAPGPDVSGTFRSAARYSAVAYTPPGHRPGDALPLVIMLHGEGIAACSPG